MNKNIDTITEELMMKYVEGAMDSDESDKFEKILSKNEYLSSRVNILQTMVDKKPLKSPSRSAHKKILSDLNIADSVGDVSFIKKYADYFMSIFEKKPILTGSLLSGIAAVFIFFTLIGDNEIEAQMAEPHNSIDYTYYEDSNSLKKEQDEESQDSIITD